MEGSHRRTVCTGGLTAKKAKRKASAVVSWKVAACDLNDRCPVRQHERQWSSGPRGGYINRHFCYLKTRWGSVNGVLVWDETRVLVQSRRGKVCSSSVERPLLRGTRGGAVQAKTHTGRPRPQYIRESSSRYCVRTGLKSLLVASNDVTMTSRTGDARSKSFKETTNLLWPLLSPRPRQKSAGGCMHEHTTLRTGEAEQSLQ